MAVIERHRTLFQRMTGTGYPAGKRPLPSRPKVASTHSPSADRAMQPVPMFGRSAAGRTRRWPIMFAALGVMAAAAGLTALAIGLVPPELTRRARNTFGGLLTTAGILLSIGLVLYVRHLMHKAMAGAASKAWGALRDAGKTNQTRAPERTRSPLADHAAPAAKSPNVVGTIIGFFVTTSFVLPIWNVLLKNLGLGRLHLLNWLPIIIYAVWAWRRHGGKL